MTLNKDKCEINKSELRYMGHTLSKHGLKIDDMKVKAVRDAKPPTNASEVKSLLGLVGFCSKFIPNYATIAEPLRKLTRKHEPWVWAIEQQTAFEKLKECLTSAQVMAYYNPAAEETQVICDGSPCGLGAILNQKQANGEMKPVAYASRTLTPVERRYSQTEREALAVLFAVERFRVYLYGTQFTVLSDSKALERIFTSKHVTTPRIQNMVLKLQPYDFKVRYLPGPQMPADILSRAPLADSDFTACDLSDKHINYVTINSLPVAVTLDELQKASESDPIINKVRTCVLSNKWSKGEELKPYYQIRSELSVKDSIILKGDKLVIPYSLQKRLLELAHESHMGVVKTKQLLRQKVWWPRIDDHVAQMIKKWRACQMTSAPPREPPVVMTKLPDGPWRELSMDITGPFQNRYYLLAVVDYYSRFPMVEILQSITSESIINQLRKWFGIMGNPAVIKTDNAANFVSVEMSNFFKENGIRHFRSMPYFARQNGLVENFNKSLKKCVRTAIAEGKNWKNELQTFLLHYRSSKHGTTNQSPSMLLMNRELRTKIPEQHKYTVPRNLRIRDRAQKAKIRFHANKLRPKTYRKYSVGQKALVLRNQKGKILHNWQDRIYRVVKQKGTSLTLRGKSGEILNRNVTHVRPYYGTEKHVGNQIQTNHRELRDRLNLKMPKRYCD